MITLLLVTFAVAIAWAMFMQTSNQKEARRAETRIRMAKQRARPPFAKKSELSEAW